MIFRSINNNDNRSASNRKGFTGDFVSLLFLKLLFYCYLIKVRLKTSKVYYMNMWTYTYSHTAGRLN